MQHIKTIVLLLLICIFTACTPHHQNKAMDRADTTLENESYDREHVSFPDTMDAVIVNLRFFPNNQFPKLFFELMNRKSADVTHPVYQVEWLDANGIPKAVTAWKPLYIRGNQTVKITETAPVQGVVDYKLIIANKEN